MFSFFGKLGWSALPQDPITAGGAISVVGAIVLILALLTYYKGWTWLWKKWLTSLDPKKIGVMYIVVAMLMLLRGGVDVLMMRGQQALSSGNSYGFLTADHFQQIFSAHGTIMIFFVAMGLMFGLINLVVPLQIGSRDVAFPFLNSLGFWLFASGMVLMNISLVVGDFSAAGWLAYPPLSELQFSPTVGVDYWIWILQIAGIGSLLSGVNFLVTIVKMRCPGMTLMRMPLFTWSVLCTMCLVVFAFPILTATLALLFLDRTMGMHFFTSGFGGNPMMYVNLIWAWGHPEVYILAMPAFGVYSEIVSTFSHKKLFGYASMVGALIAITVLSFVVWLHHFFTMGAGSDVNAFFGIMTAVIAIPTGVKIFNWIFTMYQGRIRFASPMIWFMGFIFLFTLGGFAGVLMSIPGADYQLHNSLFLVAHFHTMIVSGVVFGFFAGLTYWFPKIFGFSLNEKWGKRAAYCWIFGFVLAFGPLYILGLMGATRRLDHYAASTGWQPLFIVAAIGACIIAIGVLFQIIQLIVSVRERKQNIDTTGDPWNGRTLEWSIASPAPAYNFAIQPVVEGRDAFWTMKHKAGVAEPLASVGTIVKKVEPQYEDIVMPKNSPAGLFIGVGAFVFSFAVVWHIWWLAAVSVLFIVAVAIARLSNDHTEYVIPAAQVALQDSLVESKLRKQQSI
jgi:cytochrome o ubiquinol oxidase subunit 1